MDDVFVHYTVPTLWEFDEQGAVVVTDLQTQIPSKPSYTLRFCGDINNQGWIGVSSYKFHKGKHLHPALLLIPDDN